jgi:hypothetical protein
LAVVDYMSLEEQVDADFSHARRRALLRKVRIRLHSGGIGPSNYLRERMLGVRNYWLGTTRPDGRSHAAPVWRSVTGTALVSDTLHPTGTGADRIAAFDAGAVGGVHDVLGRGGHLCTT